MKEPVEIPISKVKLILLLIGSLGFVVAGVYLLIESDHFVERGDKSIEFIIGAGIGAVVFFGACFVWVLIKLFDSKAGLRIDDQGITDHSSGVSVGFIDWADIRGVETQKFKSQKFLVLKTDQPGKYIDKARNALKRKAMQANVGMCGSPLTISANTLKVTHQELESLITDWWQQFGKP